MTSEIPAIGGRREAREEALAVLYEVEVTLDSVSDALAARSVLPGPYALELIEGVGHHQGEIDVVIGRNLKDWRIQRMPLVDKVIARLATWELGHTDVPTGAVLNEVVELAEQYCGDQSPRFLNGVLRSIADDLRPPE